MYKSPSKNVEFLDTVPYLSTPAKKETVEIHLSLVDRK